MSANHTNTTVIITPAAMLCLYMSMAVPMASAEAMVLMT